MTAESRRNTAGPFGDGSTLRESIQHSMTPSPGAMRSVRETEPMGTALTATKDASEFLGGD